MYIFLVMLSSKILSGGGPSNNVVDNRGAVKSNILRSTGINHMIYFCYLVSY